MWTRVSGGGIALASVLATACGGGGSSTPTSPSPSGGGGAAATVTVNITASSGSQSFNPNPTVMATTGTVAWANRDGAVHRIVANEGTWDTGDIGPMTLLPSDGRPGGALIERCHLTQAAAAFLAVAGLRPLLTAWFAGCQAIVDDGYWDAGLCPCCGALPGCAELLEDGKRRLACHLCDTRWTFSRLICPLCGNRHSDDFVRLIAEGADEGYAITACGACRGYVKEIDRRARWNAGSAIVEDWGSPHLDLIAHRQNKQA